MARSLSPLISHICEYYRLSTTGGKKNSMKIHHAQDDIRNGSYSIIC